MSLKATIITVFACVLLPVQSAFAQALEPRRWTHLPVGANFAGFGYSYADVDIAFDPALRIEEATADIQTYIFSYVRVLDVFGKSGRIDLKVPYATGRWEGLLEGQPASTEREGFKDPVIRFAVNLLGSPAERGAEFRPRNDNTIVGFGLEISPPLGEYQNDKLINLGSNRWSFRPQLGLVHSWDHWAVETTASAWFYTDNDDLLGEEREQDPLYAIQGHVIYTWRPGLWLSLSGAYGDGARSKIGGVQASDETSKTLWAISVGLPINPRNGIKLAYVRGDTREDTGDDFDQFIVAYSLLWGGK